MERLENVIQRYAWGHQTAIPELLGIAPDGQPQAELWLGAHPSAPSKLSSSGLTLDAHIAQAPERLLGAASTKHFGPRLPFLFKVLAAGQPLSLQAHPTLAQAKEGFAREDAAGLARTAPNRSYRDANHKPEIICALTSFRALCGFRKLSDSVRLFEGLGLDVSLLSRGLKRYFEYAMTLSREAQGELVDRLVAGAQNRVRGFEAECELAQKLSELYPRDIGIVGALLLNLVELEPGEALYLDAGNLHAYLQGTGVELMANSDNVLRGGLTPKHVDVPQLLSVLDFTDGPATVLKAAGTEEAVYVTPAPDFRLSRVELNDRSVTLPARGAQVLLVVEGLVTVKGVALRRGESVFIGADEGDIALSGNGVVFRATAGVS